jgi:sec-independent protein translocase protein TatC
LSPNEKSEKSSGGEMPFLEHLEEFRWRVIKITLALAVASIIAYIFSDYLYKFIRWPLEQASPDRQITLNFLRLGEAFNFRIKLSLLTGIFISIPITIYQIWKFVMPGLYKHEIRMVFSLVFWSSVLFLTGAAMCYFWILPVTIKFLIEIAPEGVNPMLTLDEYLSFIMWTTLAFGLVFQLPLVSLFLGKLGIVNHSMLSRGRSYAVLGICIVAAVVTPSGDAFTMVMLALPLYLLYEISIILLKFNSKSKIKNELAG